MKKDKRYYVRPLSEAIELDAPVVLQVISGTGNEEVIIDEPGNWQE